MNASCPGFSRLTGPATEFRECSGFHLGSHFLCYSLDIFSSQWSMATLGLNSPLSHGSLPFVAYKLNIFNVCTCFVLCPLFLVVSNGLIHMVFVIPSWLEEEVGDRVDLNHLEFLPILSRYTSKSFQSHLGHSNGEQEVTAFQRRHLILNKWRKGVKDCSRFDPRESQVRYALSHILHGSVWFSDTHFIFPLLLYLTLPVSSWKKSSQVVEIT